MTHDPLRAAIEWNEDCLRWRGVVLSGKYAHWCPDWDFLPIDETTPEWPCACAADLQRAACRECTKDGGPKCDEGWCAAAVS